MQKQYHKNLAKSARAIEEHKQLPTKSELLDQELVEIDENRKDIATNSLKLAQHFGKPHKNVLRRIEKLRRSNRLRCEPIGYLDDKGRTQKFYTLDRENFSIVALGFTGEKAEQFRVEYVRQFEKNAVELIEWRNNRQAVIEPTKAANDSIAWLKVELEKELPESRKPNMLYLHIQTAITKAATGHARTEREKMTKAQLAHVEQLELQVCEKIERKKEQGAVASKIRESVLDELKNR